MDRLKKHVADSLRAQIARQEALRAAGGQVGRQGAERMRRAWVPRLEDGPGGDAESRFGGLPWLPEGTSWPSCGSCRKPANFFAQIDLATLPPGAGPLEAGLFQVFYCVACEGRASGWAPGSRAHVLRILPPGPGAVAAPGPLQPFPARRVIEWEGRDDYPSEGGALEDLPGEEGEASSEPGYPLPGEKLRGWPATTQGPQRLRCKLCRSECVHFLQIDSQGALPYMWGDAGIAHVMHCPAHPEALALYWDCY